jgi:uncharacterized protein (UPF0264 family)
MTQLLVSVRSVSEAAAALAGGASLIDVKEPINGSLGRADAATTMAVLRFVAGRRPVSAAMGELRDGESPSVPGICFVKWGVAGCAGRAWRGELEKAGDGLRQAVKYGQPVAAAYADWQRADAPPPEEVAAFAVERRWPVLLLDTWKKDGTSLFDWLPPSSVAELSRCCRVAGVHVALAGSLGFDHLELVRELQPDWLAVRGAVCRSGLRHGVIDPQRVRRLVSALTAGRIMSAMSEDSPLPR